MSSIHHSANFEQLNGSSLKIGLVVARWHNDLTFPLCDEAKRALLESNVKEENIKILDVPGSFELPFGAKMLIDQEIDVVVCVGVLVKGETMHFEYIADAVTNGIMKLQLETGTPIVFGLLTCLTQAQAEARSIGKESHGYSWGKAAVEMALKRSNS